MSMLPALSLFQPISSVSRSILYARTLLLWWFAGDGMSRWESSSPLALLAGNRPVCPSARTTRNGDPLGRTGDLWTGLLRRGATAVDSPARQSGPVAADAQPSSGLHLALCTARRHPGRIGLEDARLAAQVALLMPICLGMFLVQRQLFPPPSILEFTRDDLPPMRGSRRSTGFMTTLRTTPSSRWTRITWTLQAKTNMGFARWPSASKLASINDKGTVSMFPHFGFRTGMCRIRLSRAEQNFQAADFRHLHRDYGVTWVVLLVGGCPVSGVLIRMMWSWFARSIGVAICIPLRSSPVLHRG